MKSPSTLVRSPQDWLGNRYWKMAVSVVREARDDDAVGLAAQVAFYGMFSLFPFVIAMRSLEQYLPEGRRIIPFVLDMVQQMTSDDGRVHEILSQVLQQAESQERSVLSFGLVASVWGASRGFGVLVKAINRAYDIEDTRGWIQQRLFGVGITIVLLVFISGGVVLAIFGQRILSPLLEALGLGFLPTSAAQVIAWPVAVLLLLAGLSVLYYFAPAERGRWRWTTPGSVFAVIAMLLLSWGLSMFIAQDFYQISWLTFSSLGMFLIILLWMFFMGLAVVLGGEINAVSDRQLDEAGLGKPYEGPGTPDRPTMPPTDDDGRPISAGGKGRPT